MHLQDNNQDCVASLQVVAPQLVLANANNVIALHDFRCKSGAVQIIDFRHDSPGAYAFHEGSRAELHRWDQHSIVALVIPEMDRVLQTYDLRGTASPVNQEFVLGDDCNGLAMDVAGNTAAVMWCRSTSAQGNQLSVWDIKNMKQCGTLNGEGQQRLMRLMYNVGEDGFRSMSPFRVSDDGQHVLTPNYATDGGYSGSISVWSRQHAEEDGIDVFTNTAILPAFLEHGRVVEDELQPLDVRALDIADGLLVCGGEDALVRWAGFGH